MNKAESSHSKSLMNEQTEITAEEQLSILEQAFSAVKFSVIITDYRKPDNPIVYVNSAFEELTGYKMSEVLGVNPRILHGSDHNQKSLCDIRDAIRTGNPCSVVLSDMCKDGKKIWVKVSIVPLFDEKNKVTHFVGFTVDISNEKALEEERDYVVAALAHDTKGQIGSVQHLFAFIARGYYGAISKELAHVISIISRGNKDVLNTLENVLELYRHGRKSDSLQIDQIDLSRALPEWILIFESRVADLKVKLRCSTGSDPVICRADRLGLRRVVVNLLDNALKFTPEGGEIEIAARNTQTGTEISVTDTGEGVDEEDLENIFDQFVKAKEGRYSPGCGLGLHTCRKIIDAHGGSIRCQSNAPKPGVTFVVELPS
jgi:PAS domain S-box